MIKKEINIIGGGCAALSLARLIRNLPNYKFNLFIGNKNKTNKDHFWGFWKVKINDDAYNKANHVWSKWSINTNDSKHILTSVKHPYCVIKRKKWLDICKKQLPSQKFTILENDVLEKDGQLFVKNKKIKGDLVFDSRPPKIPTNILLQHFEGFVVTSEKDVFDEDIVTLMDFRCDQSRGMHFIYLLPFSKRKALVESTMFSKTVENKEFYSAEISKYLKKYFNLVKFTKSDHEKGIIPINNPNGGLIEMRLNFTIQIASNDGIGLLADRHIDGRPRGKRQPYEELMKRWRAIAPKKEKLRAEIVKDHGRGGNSDEGRKGTSEEVANRIQNIYMLFHTVSLHFVYQH